MGIIDICLIVVLAIFALVGFSKGFLSSVISLFGWGLTLALSIMACKPVAAFINNLTNISAIFTTWIHDGLVAFGSTLDVVYEAGTTEMTTVVSSLPDILRSVAQAILDKAVTDGTIINGTNILDYLTGILTGVAVIIVGVVVSFIIIKIIIFVLARIFDVITRSRAISGLDKLLGLVFGAAKALLVIVLACALTYIVNLTPLSATITAEIAKNPVATQVYNTADKYFDEFVETQLSNVDLNGIVAKLFGIELTEEEPPTP